MGNEVLTEDEINQLCRDMRIVDLFRSNQSILDENPEIKQEFEKYCKLVSDVVDLISEEQLNIVLETHRLQLLEIESKFAKKKKSKRLSKVEK